MEVDRQHIRRRIAKLRRDIKTLAKTRDLKRARRQDSGVPQVAIAGYTNAGKSTLMNALTGADVLVADQLFATLDPTTRRIELPGGRQADDLRHGGVRREAAARPGGGVPVHPRGGGRWRSVVHVADAASPELDEQIEAVRRVLGEIGAGDIPEVLALNKIDRVGRPTGPGSPGGSRGRSPSRRSPARG